MVYNTQQKKDQISATAISDGQDKHGRQCRFSHGDKKTIICYINSFPAVDAHYYCAETNKKNLLADLNI